MKIQLFTFMIPVFLLMVSCDGQKKAAELTTPKDSLSYAFGVMIGSDLKKSSIDTLANVDIFMASMKDMLSQDGTPLLTTEEADKIIQDYFAKMSEEKYTKNKTDGENFLTENGKKQGVITLSSGLQYEVIKEGSGTKATQQDRVLAHYTGTLIDGTTFDSSRDKDKPAEFSLSQVIPGWQEGICLMNKGAHYKLYIPWYLAYGEQGVGNLIPPYTTLVFDVELIDILPQK
jgi:FKBP-type peptidyl-prolyl cis-trans isomerase